MAVTLGLLVMYFGVLSLISFGGMPSVLPEMQRLVVETNGWATPLEFVQLFAIAQAAPGPNVLIVSLIGWKAAGLPGAVVALLAACAPAAALAWWLTDLWERFKDSPWRKAIQRAVGPLVVGLTLSGGYVLCTPASAPDPRLWAIAAVSATVMIMTRINPLWMLAAGGVVGAFLLGGCASTPQPNYAAIVASPDRSEADRQNDIRRKPAEMLAFIAPREGMVALDVSAAGGYTTELISRAVGPKGRVYGQTRAPDPRQRLAARKRDNVIAIVRPFEDPAPPDVALDLVTLMFNYHDFGHMGVDRAKMNAAIFKALKPGGLYIVADHSGRPGTGISESKTLHRVEEAFVKKEVEAAGFRLVGEGGFLRNPKDPRDKENPDPPQPKDEFVLKFVKP
jgi:predicted methyltransferase